MPAAIVTLARLVPNISASNSCVKGNDFGAKAIRTHQQPPCQPLFNRMKPVAGGDAELLPSPSFVNTAAAVAPGTDTAAKKPGQRLCVDAQSRRLDFTDRARWQNCGTRPPEEFRQKPSFADQSRLDALPIGEYGQVSISFPVLQK